MPTFTSDGSVRLREWRRRLELNNAACVLAGLKIGEGLRRLLDAVAMRDQLVELEPTGRVQREHARKIDAWHAGAEIAARECFFLEWQRHGAHRGRVAWARDPDHDGEAAAPNRAKANRGEFAAANALERVICTAARQLLQRLDWVLSGLGEERVGGAELLRHLKLGRQRVHRDDEPGAGNARALDDVQSNPAATEHDDTGARHDVRGVEYRAHPR